MSVPEFDGRGLSAVRKFESNQLAANTPNEDRRSVATCLQVCIFPHINIYLPISVYIYIPHYSTCEFTVKLFSLLQTKGMLFGVFDGHGGWACAQAVSERLLYYVAVAMMPQQTLEELERCMEHSRPVPPILQWYQHHGDFSSRESASLYIDHLRVFWQELLASEDHGEGMRSVCAGWMCVTFCHLGGFVGESSSLALSNKSPLSCLPSYIAFSLIWLSAITE